MGSVNIVLEQVAARMRDAESILFLTGAGMSADSGIPTFRDKGGLWNNFPAYKRLRVKPQDIATGETFVEDPELAWGLYEWRRRNAADNEPHDGYNVINDIVNSGKCPAFVHTTNTDGYHLRSGLPEDKVFEVHGSMWRLQPINVTIGLDFYKIVSNDDTPLCDLDYETMRVRRESIPRGGDGMMGPHIALFGFQHYYAGHIPEQSHNYRAFLDEVQTPDLVFLIGSGTAIPTNILEAEHFQSRGSKVISIRHSKRPYGKMLKPDYHISIGAEDALLRLAEKL